MAYLEEFKSRIASNDFSKFMQLWEEYSNGDSPDAEEFLAILKSIEGSDFAHSFGQYVETGIPLWSIIEDKEFSFQILKHLIDLQTTNSQLLQDLAIKALKDRYGSDTLFDVKLRLINLRGIGGFQGALSNFELLQHMDKGKFVYHSGGWGTGEIMDVSLVREQLVIEFENVVGHRDLSFENAFKTLSPIADDHFLAKRFGDPDRLEAEGKEDPLKLVHLLLKDLGPKTASEIKEELCVLVIPEEEWTKWWQGARSRLKKDTLIQSPSSVKEPFVLRDHALSHEERFQQELMNKKGVEEVLLAAYNYTRDFSQTLKKEGVKEMLVSKIEELLEQDLSFPQQIEILLFLENFLSHKVEGRLLEELIPGVDNPLFTIEQIQILALKKRFLMALKKYHSNYIEQFLNLFLAVGQNSLKEFIATELSKEETVTKFEHRLEELLHHPTKYPETFVWYFQKLLSDKEALFADKDGQCEFLEGFMILLSFLEREPKYRDLAKKMYQILTNKRFLVTRNILEGSSVDFAKEFLLLVTKCQSFNSHDLKIMQSLVEVAHPELASGKSDSQAEEHIIWTTDEGFNKTRARIEEIGSTEMVENAREIEEARSHGDLRENSEYKFALERRARLQGELKLLSELLNQARVLTETDIDPSKIGVGCVVDLINSENEKVTFTLLGPWDADPDNHILSFQSKMAEAMMGHTVGESFSFRHDSYKVAAIRSYLD